MNLTPHAPVFWGRIPVMTFDAILRINLFWRRNRIYTPRKYTGCVQGTGYAARHGSQVRECGRVSTVADSFGCEDVSSEPCTFFENPFLVRKMALHVRRGRKTTLEAACDGLPYFFYDLRIRLSGEKITPFFIDDERQRSCPSESFHSDERPPREVKCFFHVCVRIDLTGAWAVAVFTFQFNDLRNSCRTRRMP